MKSSNVCFSSQYMIEIYEIIFCLYYDSYDPEATWLNFPDRL